MVSEVLFAQPGRSVDSLQHRPVLVTAPICTCYVGQRKGIGIAHKEPLYVININAKKNEVTVGNKETLAIKTIYLNNLNLLSHVEKYNDNLLIKVRSTGSLLKAKVNLDNNTAKVNLDDLETGISPGQACVFYSKNQFGDKVLGGGWIVETENNYLSTQSTGSS